MRSILLFAFSIASAADAQNSSLSPRDLFLAGAKPDTSSPQESTRARTSGVQSRDRVLETTIPPLSVRYALLRRQPSGAFTGVDPDSAVFGKGDQVRLSVQVNQPAYLYVFQRGSSRRWSVLFPLSASTTNPLPAFQLCDIPGAGGAFAFDDRPGEEFVLLLASRDPLNAGVIAAQLNERSRNSQPGNQPPRGPDRMSASLLGASQTLRPRDLVYEKIENDRQSAFPGTSIYASGAESTAAPVIIPITLIHTSSTAEGRNR